MQHESYTRLFEQAVIVTRGSARPILLEADLAWHLNMSQQRLNGWQSRGVSKQGALEAEKVLGISANYILEGLGVPELAATPGQDHGVSQSSLSIGAQDNTTVTWGAMRHEALPGIFEVTVPDNAMADRVKKGYRVTFDKHRKPRPDEGILVANAAGEWFFRAFIPGSAGRFKAVPLNKDYPTLDSEADRLTILGVRISHTSDEVWG